MHRQIAVLALCGLLWGCGTTAAVVVPVPDPCPPSAAAAPETKPAAPTLTDQQRLAVDVAVLGVLGEVLFVAREGAQTARDLWADRQAQRVRQTRLWCASRA